MKSSWPGDVEMESNVIVSGDEAKGAAGKPIENVIFDFGNVLVDWEPQAALLPRYSKELTDKFLDNDNSGFCDISDAMDMGGTKAEAIAAMREQYGEPWTSMFEYYLENFLDSLVGTVEGMRVMVNDLKAAGIGVWGLSNWSADLFPPAKEVYPILSSLDDAVISGFVKLRKPHCDIFKFALKRFDIPSDTALFVDDKGMNIVGSNSAGIRGVKFTDACNLRKLLKGQGIVIPGIIG
ncbi:HAD family phosphatase [Bifidobacterium sp. ESL0745]|uniref:HAD family hydrolase n=1 Tax=Bifidobacterium sp. ESL0745 TaxID=2983226 RepID=UPI0023F6E11D|nr:HAD family phosphatase [Bifidobacterium sp. ESL0745]MDF7664896.1 HAD family phosphatase [Bifidobacterium sp. ESL0745]